MVFIKSLQEKTITARLIRAGQGRAGQAGILPADICCSLLLKLSAAKIHTLHLKHGRPLNIVNQETVTEALEHCGDCQLLQLHGAG